MKYTIKIECDNAAFEDVPGNEIARILRELADKVDGGQDPTDCDATVYDYNGNRVGEAKLSD